MSEGQADSIDNLLRERLVVKAVFVGHGAASPTVLVNGRTLSPARGSQ